MIARGAELIVNYQTSSFRLFFRVCFASLLPGVWLAASMACAVGAELPQAAPLRIAVYDVASYGYANPDGSISGISVDLWRRVAERLERQFKLIPVSEMESLLSGLEQGHFDAAIGAITITPEREKRVDFSYPAHRSGVAVALRKEKGPFAALKSYAAAATELGPLIISSLAMLVLIGIVMWLIERRHPLAQNSESSVVTLRDGLYWAIVTMTTVGYGDKTPKSSTGRVIAVSWMFASLVWVSLLSTSLVSRLTVERVESRDLAAGIDLTRKKLAAVAQSSGAEYLDQHHLQYMKFINLPDALDSLAGGTSDAVVNSVGALQYLISKRYAGTEEMPQGLLAPAYMAIALPEHSPLKRPIDEALVKITSDPEWISIEDRFFGK
ncbi:MAG TPA: transporter substrate-binding domain-containing protein [Bradyrhizobium sp.]